MPESATIVTETDVLAAQRHAVERALLRQRRREERRACREFAETKLRVPFLRHIRGGRWHPWHDAATGLEPHLTQEIASRRYALADGEKDAAPSHHLVEAKYLFLADLVRMVERQGLVEVRTLPDGVKELRSTPRPTPFNIEPGFADLLPRFPAEIAALEDRLLAEGCRDAVVVWKEARILVDGHVRVAFCTLLGMPYPIKEISFASRDAAIGWIWAHHLGRRNAPEELKSYRRGSRYLAEKGKRGGDRRSGRAKCSSCTLTTAQFAAEALAQSYGVSRRTIYMDARFATAMNRVAAVAGDEVRQKVLSRQWKLFRGEIINLAKLDDEALKLKIEEVAAAGGRLPPGDRPEPNASGLPSNPRAQVLALAEVLDRKGLERLGKALNSYLKGRWTEESERARNRDDSNGQDGDSSEGTAL